MNFSLNSSLNLVILSRTPVHSDSKQALFLASRSATAPDDYQNLFREISGLIETYDRNKRQNCECLLRKWKAILVLNNFFYKAEFIKLGLNFNSIKRKILHARKNYGKSL